MYREPDAIGVSVVTAHEVSLGTQDGDGYVTGQCSCGWRPTFGWCPDLSEVEEEVATHRGRDETLNFVPRCPSCGQAVWIWSDDGEAAGLNAACVVCELQWLPSRLDEVWEPVPYERTGA